MGDVLGQRDALGQFLDALAPTISAVGQVQQQQQRAQRQQQQAQQQQKQLALAQQKEDRLQESSDFDDTVKILQHFDNPQNALNVAQNIATDTNSSAGERKAATTMAQGFRGQVAGNTVFEDILDNGSLREIADLTNDLNIPKSQRDAAKTTLANKRNLNRDIRVMAGLSQKREEKAQQKQFIMQGLSKGDFKGEDEKLIRNLAKTGNFDRAFSVATGGNDEDALAAALIQALGGQGGQSQGGAQAGGEDVTRTGEIQGRAGIFNETQGTFTFDDDPSNPIFIAQ